MVKARWVSFQDSADLSPKLLLITWPETIVPPDDSATSVYQIVGRCRFHSKLPGDGTVDVEAGRKREAVPFVELSGPHDVVGHIDRHDLESARGEFLVDVLQVRKLLTARQSRWRPEVHQRDRPARIEADTLL